MQQLLFLYDALMCQEEQNLFHTKIDFFSYGIVQAKMRFFNDKRKRRKYINVLKNPTLSYVYGGIFLVDDWKDFMSMFCAYYNSSMHILGKQLQEDLFVLQEIDVIPISLKSIKEINECTYTMYDKIKCMSFVGNSANAKIKHSNSKKYYSESRIDTVNFLTMIKENNAKKR